MVKEPPRKCSFCGQHGHNSRTCTNNNNNNIISKGPCLKLFGVNILDEAAASAADSMKKSQSMGNLASACDKGANDVVSSASSASDHESGYLSDGVIQNKRRKAAHERKRGTPWSEEEHRTFLAGLNDLGKGDWRGISMKYVPTRTPTQVASHAQKYFLRQQASNDKKKRRSSLFDMTYKPEEVEPQRYQVTSMMKSASQTLPTLAGGSQTLPGNSSHEIMSRFPHLCLDNYMVPVRPATNAQSYHPIPYPYSVGVPANVQPLMMNYGIPSYLYNVPSSFPLNNNNNMNASSFAPVMVAHPSGIPQPRSNPSSPSIAKRDGLELKIGQPQAKQGSGPSSPPSGAIRVT